MNTALTQQRLQQLLAYDSATGVFTRLVPGGSHGRFVAGTVSGSLDKASGYVGVYVDGMEYWAHRLAWFYVHGVWAPHDVDHKDRIRHHNWIENLRPATRAQNLQNQVEANAASKSGIRGVHWDKCRGKWRVELSVGNKNKLIGRFDSQDLAAAAYLRAKAELHPGSIV